MYLGLIKTIKTDRGMITLGFYIKLVLLLRWSFTGSFSLKLRDKSLGKTACKRKYSANKCMLIDTAM